MPSRLFLSSGDLMADRRFDFARDLQFKGDLVAAADLLLQATELAPDFASAWFTLGGIREQLGERDEAIDAMEQSETVDHMVIFSGDGDFTTLVEALQRRGRKVSVISTMATQPPMIADDLRRQADHFIDLVSLKAEIGRDPSERPARPMEATQTTEQED